MSLVNMKSLLENAQNGGYAVGAFNMLSIENVRGAIKAAEELNSPIILMLAEVHMPMAPIEYMAPIMIEAAKNAKVPVAVHFDHGVSFDKIVMAINLGFTSVMFDGASKPLEENIRLTKQIIDIAHPRNITVEAELGKVGLGMDGNIKGEDCLTRVEDAVIFSEKTGIDALAVAIGNLHGEYKETPQLHFDRLDQINSAIKTPLVLHGGSGISPEDFRKCVNLGIRKINIGTALQLKSTSKIKNNIEENRDKITYFDIMDSIIEGSYEAVKEHLIIFGSDDKI